MNTHRAAQEDPKHSPFLKSFGQFHVASLTQSEASPDKVMLEMLADIQRELTLIRRRDRERPFPIERVETPNVIRRAIMEVITSWCQKNETTPAGFKLDEDFMKDLRKVMDQYPGYVISAFDIQSILAEMRAAMKA